MVILLDRLEKTTHSEHECQHSIETAQNLGRIAIRAEQLGINDPVTHLYQYLESGHDAEAGIEEDIVTDIAERLPRTPFVNIIGFEFAGNDIVSVKDKVSMKEMTRNNLRIVSEESSIDPTMGRELTRAQSESAEVDKLIDWFDKAPLGSSMVFESLPIGPQEFAIVRIYRKIGKKNLEGSFVSLYSADIPTFNLLRKTITGENAGETEEEILANSFVVEGSDFDIDKYVDLYDQALNNKNGKQHFFGLTGDVTENGLEKVKKYPGLTSIYTETIKTLASSGGVVTQGLIDLTGKLDLGIRLQKDQTISCELAREILRDVTRGIASVIDRAGKELLADLATTTERNASYSAVAYYSSQAKSDGVTYSSGGCPEYARTQSENGNSESTTISESFDTYRGLKNFGKPKVGVCRIQNCPSRGNWTFFPDKTLVGGCDVCVGCHKLFAQGKNPTSIYTKVA